MKRILVITGLIPIKEVQKSKDENDILLVTEDYIKKFYPDLEFHYIYTQPKVNRILSLLSDQWNAYYKVQKQKKYEVQGREIDILLVITLRKRYFFRNLLYRFSLWEHRKRIASIIKEKKPTMIHAQAVDGNTYFAKKISQKYNIPYVVTVRGLNVHVDDLIIKGLNKAKRIIALSPTQKKDAENILDHSVDLIPHGIPDHFFKANIKKTLIPPIKFVVICRLLKLKNLDKVIKELALLKHDYIFHIYGRGPEKDSLQSLITELKLENKIELKGYIPNAELPQTLQQYDVFVMPSTPETLGRVYFEAMACGLPVVASQKTGIDGIITNGSEGFLVDHSNNSSLKDILTAIFENTEKILEMRDKALQLAGRFKWDKVARQLYEIYE